MNDRLDLILSELQKINQRLDNLYELIEDEFDLLSVERELEEHQKNPITFTIDEVHELLELDNLDVDLSDLDIDLDDLLQED